jgi:hypothetical protein
MIIPAIADPLHKIAFADGQWEEVMVNLAAASF